MHPLTECLQMFKDCGPPDTHTHTNAHNPSFHKDSILKCLFLKQSRSTAIWPHTASFSSPRVSKAKTQAARGVWVCMCLCLDKQVKNVLGGEPFLPWAHLGIFVAPSHLSVPLSCFLSDRSDSSGWFAWVLRDTAFPCLWVCVCECRWIWHQPEAVWALCFPDAQLLCVEELVWNLILFPPCSESSAKTSRYTGKLLRFPAFFLLVYTDILAVVNKEIIITTNKNNAKRACPQARLVTYWKHLAP